jgi:glycine cleavage system H protein
MVALFVIGTIITCVLIEYVRGRTKQNALALQPAHSRNGQRDRVLLPRGYFISKHHAWAELLFSGNVRIGADDFAQKVVGTIDAVEIVPQGSDIKKGEPLFHIKQGNRTLSFPSPFSGKVSQINLQLLDSPSLLKEAPYFDGWIAVIEPTNFSSELKLLTIADEAAQWLRAEISRFRNFLSNEQAVNAAVPAGATLLDGGIPMNGVLQTTNDKTWKEFEQMFLHNSN